MGANIQQSKLRPLRLNSLAHAFGQNAVWALAARLTLKSKLVFVFRLPQPELFKTVQYELKVVGE